MEYLLFFPIKTHARSLYVSRAERLQYGAPEHPLYKHLHFSTVYGDIHNLIQTI